MVITRAKLSFNFALMSINSASLLKNPLLMSIGGVYSGFGALNHSYLNYLKCLEWFTSPQGFLRPLSPPLVWHRLRHRSCQICTPALLRDARERAYCCISSVSFTLYLTFSSCDFNFKSYHSIGFWKILKLFWHSEE